MAFITDAYSRMVVGWQASRSLRSDLAIDALEMAVHNRRRAGADLSQLTHHSDRGVQGGFKWSSQYLSVRYSQRLADNEIVASVGSKGDSYDNAMIESFNWLYKWELIYPHGPWEGLEDVEFATLEYVDWFNVDFVHNGARNARSRRGPHRGPARARSRVLLECASVVQGRRGSHRRVTSISATRHHSTVAP